MTNSRICKVEGCGKPFHAKGWCYKHYARHWRNGTTDIPKRKARPLRAEGDIVVITLTKGYEAFIDAADTHLVEGLNWQTDDSNRTMYAVRNVKGGHSRLHRLIMDAPDHLEVDHINGNGLDNRRQNLRLATKNQNQHNRRTNRSSASGIKGVHLRPSGGWSAYISKNGRRMHLGTYNTSEEAHAAYCEASKRLHGPYGRAK